MQRRARAAVRVSAPGLALPDSPDLFGRAPERERQGPTSRSRTGFIIDPDGYILTITT
jgi:S1-C subfamily serine protease